MKMFFKIMGLVAFICVAMYALCSVDNVKYKEETVQAVITKKDYVPPRTYTTFMSTGKSVIPIVNTVPAEYNIIVKYNNLSDTIESKELYDALKVGDSIQVKHVLKYSKDKNEFLGDYIEQK